MDKSDVGMEDAEKEAQRGSEDIKESEDDNVDAKVEPEGKQVTSFAVVDLKATGTGAKCDTLPEELINAKCADLSNNKADADDQINAKIEIEDQSIASSKAEDQNKAKGQPEDHPDIKIEMKGTTLLQTADKGENSSESGRGGGILLQNKMEDQKASEKAEEEKNSSLNGKLPFQLPVSEVPPKKKEVVDEVHQSEQEGKGLVDLVHHSETEALMDELKEPGNNSVLPTTLAGEDAKLGEKTIKKGTKPEPSDTPLGSKRQPATPDLSVKYSSMRSGDPSKETLKNAFNVVKMGESDDGTPEEQAAFMKEVENFYRERALEFKPPKFYGQPLNCLKLWRAVIKWGGYDRVTGSKLWRQVGESFHPPKTCTTVSWTFRIFYEKSLLEYERYQMQIGELQLPVAALPEPSSVENEGNGYQASGSGRARRDAATRAMQGWHAQRLFGFGEVGEPIIKDKKLNNMPKRENKLKSIGSLKQKRPNEVELPMKAQRTETSKQLATTVVDVGPPADWVKINVRETKDCFEVYALVPGLLREEVRVQSDPAGRLVITGQPEQPDNPWGITAFKKVVSLPGRIDPLQTSAVVSLHGRLFVRVPFEQSNI